MNNEPNGQVTVPALMQRVSGGFTDAAGYPMYENTAQVYCYMSTIGVWFLISQFEMNVENDNG